MSSAKNSPVVSSWIISRLSVCLWNRVSCNALFYIFILSTRALKALLHSLRVISVALSALLCIGNAFRPLALRHF